MKNKELLDYLAQRAQEEEDRERRQLGRISHLKFYESIKRILDLEENGNDENATEKECNDFMKKIERIRDGGTVRSYYNKLQIIIQNYDYDGAALTSLCEKLNEKQREKNSKKHVKRIDPLGNIFKRTIKKDVSVTISEQLDSAIQLEEDLAMQNIAKTSYNENKNQIIKDFSTVANDISHLHLRNVIADYKKNNNIRVAKNYRISKNNKMVQYPALRQLFKEADKTLKSKRLEKDTQSKAKGVIQ